MKNLTGLKIGLCQMPVVPGRPDVNTDYMVREITAAAKRGDDIIVFPELCVPGYLIGDKWENDCFVRDITRHNEMVREATRAGICAIFGSLKAEEEKKGEDGRMRKSNSGFIAQDGAWIGSTDKFLQPNYRFFDDDRHFYSLRKKMDEMVGGLLRSFKSGQVPRIDLTETFRNLFQVFHLQTRIGPVAVGVILCEDMWHDDYAFNPTEYLVANGAEVIINLSASPWGWQKNRKRHSVVKKLLTENPVLFVYVNKTGLQNNGKNLIVFDGSSTVYRADGEIVFAVEPYAVGTHTVTLAKDMPVVVQKPQDDTGELYSAVRNGLRYFFAGMKPDVKVLVGLSGGIDSSLAAALYTDVLGPGRVIGVHMPFKFTEADSTSIAEQVAKNLGIRYEVEPIADIVEAISRAGGIDPANPAHRVHYGNIQAHARREVLSTKGYKYGAVYSANFNKIEGAFGYGTLYADIAGFLAALGDFTKLDEYKLAEYLNRKVFGREVIPRACFVKPPTAELEDAQVDPFDYGKLDPQESPFRPRRGYHDEMVRAFIEFRKDPEWFADCFLAHTLEFEMGLEAGTLKHLFPTGKAFIADLEKHWNLIHWQYFKRVQTPPNIVVSKRAFGYDNRESLLSPYYTLRYREALKPKIEALTG